MKKYILLIAILLIGLSACKKEKTVEPTPTPPPVVEGYGKLKVIVSEMNIKQIDLVNGYDVYKLIANWYGGSPGDYWQIFLDIKNKTYAYTISYTNVSTLSTGNVTIIKDQTVEITGL